MNNILITFFSGTGNTLRAINIIKDIFIKEKPDLVIDFLCIDNKSIESEKDYDLYIFAFPILVFSPPRIFTEYIKKIKKNNKPAVILTINGALVSKNKIIVGHSGFAPFYINRILNKKGFNILKIDNISYPDNWSQFTNPPDENEIKIIYEESDIKVKKFTYDIIENNFIDTKPALIDKLLLRYMIPIYNLFIGRMLGKVFIADKKCNECRLCEKLCPVTTIKISGKKPVWGINCIACNRCINLCPQKAIQTSFMRIIYHGLIGLIIYLFALEISTNLIQKIFYNINNFLIILLIILAGILDLIILIIFQLTLYDWLIRLLEKIPFLRPLFEISFSKNFRRYKEKDFNNLI